MVTQAVMKPGVEGGEMFSKPVGQFLLQGSPA
jgi:hypothetical protein